MLSKTKQNNKMKKQKTHINERKRFARSPNTHTHTCQNMTFTCKRTLFTKFSFRVQFSLLEELIKTLTHVKRGRQLQLKSKQE